VLWLTILPVVGLIWLFHLQRTNRLAVPKMTLRYGVLYEVYKPERWYWEGFVLIRRLSLVWITVALSQDDSQRNAWLSFANILFLMAHMLARPYRNDQHNQSETAALAILALITTLLPALSDPMTVGQSVGMGLLVFPPAIVFVSLYIRHRHTRWMLHRRSTAIAHGRLRHEGDGGGGNKKVVTVIDDTSLSTGTRADMSSLSPSSSSSLSSDTSATEMTAPHSSSTHAL